MRIKQNFASLIQRTQSIYSKESIMEFIETEASKKSNFRDNLQEAQRNNVSLTLNDEFNQKMNFGDGFSRTLTLSERVGKGLSKKFGFEGSQSSVPIIGGTSINIGGKR